MRITSGGTANAGTNGSRLTPSPMAMRTRGPATLNRGAITVTREITTIPPTMMRRGSTTLRG